MDIIKSSVFPVDVLVSVVIPSYNRKEVVHHTIDSILNQKCNFKYEIIIGDDCSNDGVHDILNNYLQLYPDKILLIFHEKNIGLAANWAKCVKQSKAKYIANCDNDDYWHNEKKLQMQVDFMELHPEFGMCHTNYRIHNRDTNVIQEISASNNFINTNESLQKSIMNGNFRCCNATVLYRKDVLLNYVNLDDYIKYQFTLQDWNTWMIIAKYTEFACLPISTATFGIETVSITRPKDFEKLEQRLLKERECYKYICDLFPIDFPYKNEDYDEYENDRLMNLAIKYNNFEKARKYSLLIKSKNYKKIIVKYKFLFLIFWMIKKTKNVFSNNTII